MAYSLQYLHSKYLSKFYTIQCWSNFCFITWPTLSPHQYSIIESFFETSGVRVWIQLFILKKQRNTLYFSAKFLISSCPMTTATQLVSPLLPQRFINLDAKVLSLSPQSMLVRVRFLLGFWSGSLWRKIKYPVNDFWLVPWIIPLLSTQTTSVFQARHPVMIVDVFRALPHLKSICQGPLTHSTTARDTSLYSASIENIIPQCLKKLKK